MKKQVIPMLIFAVLVAFLAVGLTLNPKDVPSPLIDKPAPAFELPELYTQEQVSSTSLLGQPYIMNVWASWCLACEHEHQLLVDFAKTYAVNLIGLNYKDDNDAAQQWLKQRGNPYSLILQDGEGKTGINWGVYGVPETFIVDAKGLIRHKFTGPITTDSLKSELIPLLEQLYQEAGLTPETTL